MFEGLFFLKLIIYTSLIKVEFNRPQIILISITIAIFLFSFARVFGGSKKKVFTALLYSFLSVLMLINAVYFAQYNSLTSVAVIKQIPQLKTVGDNLKILLDYKKAALVIDIPLLLMFVLSQKRRLETPDSGTRIVNAKLMIVTVLILALVIPYYSKTGQLKSIAAQELFMYHSLDIGKNIFNDLDAAAEVVTSEDLIKMVRKRRNLKDGNYTGIGKDMNLIVIQVEALQNFVVNQRYLGVEITPNLNRLIMNPGTLYYDNYFQLIGKGNTSDAEFVSQNSLYPSSGEPTYLKYADNAYFGLPWLLRNAGYTAWAFHGYERNYWNRDNAYRNIGFQRFIAEDDFLFDETVGFGITDKDFLDQSIWYLNKLDSMDEDPFYAFMVTLTSHTPFIMPEQYKELQLRSEHQNTILGDYLQSINYTDKQLGMFIQRLKDEGLYNDTVIAIYGDHFALNANNETDKSLMEVFLNKPYEYDSMMNVPLVIHVPGAELRETISTLGSQLDFYPTISNIMGLKITKGIIFGQDLNNPGKIPVVFPMSYIKPGSVVTSSRFFEMAKDEIFEHSRAFDRSTGQLIDIEPFRHLSKQGLNEIMLSNYILENNLILE
jgi:phosphoglycerol transferase MdoB-like AlkP superfamily enzyme